MRWSLNQLYTRFAFAYDLVSMVVSQGEWRAWTRAAIPFVQGTRILEIAFGTGNLHLDLYEAGYSPVGVDLSPNMHALTQAKFRARKRADGKIELPRLARARAQELPFRDEAFSCLVMTFPPAFVYDLQAMREMWRVLEPHGTLLWVDAPSIYPRGLWSGLLNRLFLVTGGCANAETDEIKIFLRDAHGGVLERMWTWSVERTEMQHSAIHIFTGVKNEKLD